MKKIILFSGKAENGKTTAAELLKDILESEGQSVVITRYAYYLKDLAKRYCDDNSYKFINAILDKIGLEYAKK